MSRETDMRLGILISGSGSTMEAVLKARAIGELDGMNPVAVIASRPDSRGLEKADLLGVKSYLINRKDYENSELFGEALLQLLRLLKVEFVSQNGWLPKTPDAVLSEFSGRIINQHPGPLDPGRADFGGKGMYGKRVSAARVAYSWATGGEYWTEATVHRVTSQYDNGALIAVKRMPFRESESVLTIASLMENTQELSAMTEEVAGSLLPLEHELVVRTLRTIGETRSVPVYERMQPLVPAPFEPILNEAKQAAISLYPHG